MIGIQVAVATRFEQDYRVCSRNVGPFWKPESTGKPRGVRNLNARVSGRGGPNDNKAPIAAWRHTRIANRRGRRR
jgi:hypothetical protein